VRGCGGGEERVAVGGQLGAFGVVEGAQCRHDGVEVGDVDAAAGERSFEHGEQRADLGAGTVLFGLAARSTITIAFEPGQVERQSLGGGRTRRRGGCRLSATGDSGVVGVGVFVEQCSGDLVAAPGELHIAGRDESTYLLQRSGQHIQLTVRAGGQIRARQQSDCCFDSPHVATDRHG
jgi:hypothetical protein